MKDTIVVWATCLVVLLATQAARARENPSLRSAQTKSQRVVRKGSVSSFGKRQLRVTPQSRVRLSTVARRAFAEQRSLQQQLGGARGALFGAPVVREEVIELRDSYVITRTTRFTVKDEKRLAGRSSVWRRTLGSAKGRLRLGRLSAAAKKELATYRASLRKLPATHPMRVAEAKGAQAVLDAISAGLGDQAVTDTIVVAKKPLGLGVKYGGALVPVGGRFVLRPRQFELDLVRAKLEGHAAGQVSTPGSQTSGTSSGGRLVLSDDFLGQIDLSYGALWERRYEYPSGFTRITLNTDYAFQLRTPIDATIDFRPTEIATRDSSDKSTTFTTDVTLAPRDATASWYSQAGVPASAVKQGKELLVSGSLTFGYKVRLGWTDIAYQPWRTKSFRPRRHDVALLGDPSQWQKVVESWIRAPEASTLIDEGLDPLASVSGGVEPGYRLMVKGAPTAKVSLRYDDQTLRSSRSPGNASSKIHDLLFREGRSYRFRGVLPTEPESGTWSYGVHADSVGWRGSVRMQAGVHLTLQASIFGLSFGPSTKFWVSDTLVQEDDVTSGYAAGTPIHFRNRSGRKTLTKTPGGHQ